MPFFFTPAQANECLPEVREIMDAIFAIRARAESRDDGRFCEQMNEFKEALERLEELGCTLKSVEEGLVDFPAVRKGVRVWLCWKYGEEKVDHWHGLEEGFANRKKIRTNEFLDDDSAIHGFENPHPRPKAEPWGRTS
jgi:hypothetical protein